MSSHGQKMSQMTQFYILIHLWCFCVPVSVKLHRFESPGKSASQMLIVSVLLTAHNWQKWKRVFLLCPCHKIYRVEAVGLRTPNYSWKIMIFVNIWGNFVKNWHFLNNCLIKVWILKFFCIYVTHFILIIWCTPHFVSTIKTDFPSQFCIFYCKIT